jgi:hypothetical protein
MPRGPTHSLYTLLLLPGTLGQKRHKVALHLLSSAGTVMQSLSARVRWIVVGLFGVFVAPIIVEFLKRQAEKIGLYERPGEVVERVVTFISSFAEVPWVRLTALSLGSFVAGLWLDWLLRQLDGSRTDARKKLGLEMQLLAQSIEGASEIGLVRLRPEVSPILTRARKLGLWVPPHQAAFDILQAYLETVGGQLGTGYFGEAKKAALNMKRRLAP